MAVEVEQRKWVYSFNEGDASMRRLLGGKGAGLAEMTNAGLPVPPGITITTEGCTSFYANNRELPDELWIQVLTSLNNLQKETGKQLGNPQNPLIVSVRSGAAVSMPGMMETILNVGLNHKTVYGLAESSGDERFAWDAYRRLIHMFGKTVMGVDESLFDGKLEETRRRNNIEVDQDLGIDTLKGLVADFKQIIKDKTGKDFPQDPIEQIKVAVVAVFDSWHGKKAIDYRNFHGLSHDLGTAVNIQMMVFGNMGEDSGTGVAFTRNPNTGERELYGEYLPKAQGEDVVAGTSTPEPISRLQEIAPAIYEQLVPTADALERHYGDAQDLEFTVERGKLYMLQTRTAKRSASAAVRIALDMINEGLIDEPQAIMRITTSQVEQLVAARFEEEPKKAAVAERLLTKGIDASPGAAVGQAVFDADKAEELSKEGKDVILVRPETSPDDVHGIIAAKGVLTARGGKTSHAAVVTRSMGKPAVVGAEDIKIDLDKREMLVNGRIVKEGEVISIDGKTGEVFTGEIPTIKPGAKENVALLELLKIADQYAKLQVWANADYPRDAQVARDFGAQGIGLCRTEHMFFEPDRLPIVQEMILVAPRARALRIKVEVLRSRIETTTDLTQKQKLQGELSKAESEWINSPFKQKYESTLVELLNFQREDFKGIMRIMEGLPTVIRLLDPPMHEFLPNEDKLQEELSQRRSHQPDAPDIPYLEELLAVAQELHEENPMLGKRGVRLAILYPEIPEMQVRAIFEAACQLKKKGIDVKPEIMVPLVAFQSELGLAKKQLESVAKAVMDEQGVSVDYKFGTMMEVPRAVFIADELAKDAEFFSFGTNDMTQMGTGMSRDDTEALLEEYRRMGLIPKSPFESLDRGIAKMVKMGVQLGRSTRPDSEIGVCGEHGGDPDSIKIFHELGLNYVSSSAYRVPVARLAAAQTALAEKIS